MAMELKKTAHNFGTKTLAQQCQPFWRRVIYPKASQLAKTKRDQI